jgi:serine/threonine protein kinase
VTYYGHEEKDNELRIYMEFMPQSLHQLITQRRREGKPFLAAEIKKLASDVARGLDHLHSLPRPIIHRDVKSKNVLVDCRPGYIHVAKLCDFGVSIVVNDEKQMADTRIGTTTQ